VGNIYAADFNSYKLFRITPTRQITTVAQSYLDKPFKGLNDLCFDQAGNLFFTDPNG